MEKEIIVPETLQEAIVYFANPDNALTFMVTVRWPDGVECPYCASKEVRFMTVEQKSKSKKEPGKIIKRSLWQCNAKGCRKQFTAKVGTIFEDSPLGLEKWFPSLWLLTNCKNGISSYELSRALGITQKSTWFMIHRLREAMKAGTILKMTGTVESDETYIGGLEKNKHANKKLRQRRGAVGKAIVQDVIERGEPGRKSRVAAKVVKGTDAKTLQEHPADCRSRF